MAEVGLGKGGLVAVVKGSAKYDEQGHLMKRRQKISASNFAAQVDRGLANRGPCALTAGDRRLFFFRICTVEALLLVCHDSVTELWCLATATRELCAFHSWCARSAACANCRAGAMRAHR